MKKLLLLVLAAALCLAIFAGCERGNVSTTMDGDVNGTNSTASTQSTTTPTGTMGDTGTSGTIGSGSGSAGSTAE